MSEQTTQFLRRANYWRPVVVRGFLYFFIAAAPVFVDLTKDVGQIEVVPPVQWLRYILISCVAGATSVRAFMDGSLQRHKDEAGPPPH